jgi:hypothetical protein
LKYSFKNNDLFSVKTLFLVAVLIVTINFGCEPISVPSPPSDYDLPALINGFVVPDTVLENSQFNVQISYQVECNEQFVTVRLEDAVTRKTYTPILHIYPDQKCGSPASTVTSKDTLRIADSGADTLIFSGQRFSSAKQITILPFWNPPIGFTFHFLFRDLQGGLANHATTFQRLDGGPIKPIHADTLGYWDTTFTDNNF